MAGKGRKSNKRNAAAGVSPHQHHLDDDFMDDEIDAFHKQRDVVPLDMNHDEGDSDDDNDHPVYDVKHDSSSEDEDEDDDDVDDDKVVEKFIKQSRYIQAKILGAEDETLDDIEEEEDPKKSSVWGRKKDAYYNADNADFEVQTDDDEQLEEEEAEVLRLQHEKTKGLSMEDYGLGEDEGGVEPTFEDILVKGKTVSRSSNKEPQDVTETAYEVVKKDLNALSREEQMDIVYSSAPELVGLLSELNDAVEQLDNKVNPILSKVREGDGEKKKRVQYFEMKKQLLLSYCQAITFYLLLKSEGQPVRDHPVIARLVEIKNLLDRVKQLDENLPSEVDDILKEEHCSATEVKLSEEDAALKSNGFINSHNPSVIPSDIQDHVAAELVKVGSLRDDSKGKRKRQDEQLGAQSMEMLKVRAALEEKLKQRGVLGFTASKPAKAKKSLRPINGQLEAPDDFDDEAVDVAGSRYGNADGNVNVLRSNKLSQLVAPRVKKPKVREGDGEKKKRVQYLEMKKQLLLSYCQAISFYLLLKSEGQPVRDHPVIARLVEIKNLLDRVKQLDENLPSVVDDILKEEHCSATEVKLSEEDAALKSNGFTNSHNPSVIPSDIQDHVAAELVKVGSLRDDSKGKRKRQDEQLGAQSVEMLKVRAALEEKLKQRGVLGFTASKPARAKKSLRPINGQLEALDDFDDEAVDVAGSRYGNADGNVNILRSNKLSQLVAPRVKKPKVIFGGDDDLPKRDDIGEVKEA